MGKDEAIRKDAEKAKEIENGAKMGGEFGDGIAALEKLNGLLRDVETLKEGPAKGTTAVLHASLAVNKAIRRVESRISREKAVKVKESSPDPDPLEATQDEEEPEPAFDAKGDQVEESEGEEE